ncbi:hypothetical protein K438DRAFT_1759281 [Mycena galopus ATCC 62051]|nr:hypothetical protein K438DRAFT_1759281 [Mycena galopus ATCC 62051]
MQNHITQTQLSAVAICLTEVIEPLALVSAHLKNTSVEAISATTQSLLLSLETVNQNRKGCTQLLETTCQLLNALIDLHMDSETLGELPPTTLPHIEKFAETLENINNFVRGQRKSSLIKKVLHSREMSTLLKDCHTGLEEALNFFKVGHNIYWGSTTAEIVKIEGVNIVVDIVRMQQQAQKRHKEMLNFIDSLSDTSGSDNASSTMAMLPSEPKIFHGRESEVAHILDHFSQGVPRIAILGAGGMGKTALARAVLHHPDIAVRYDHHRIFINCDAAATHGNDLAVIICTHLGLKSWKDPIRAAMGHFSSGSQFLLILDNLESVWEPLESRIQIEKFLCLLADVKDLALISQITMRGAERPAKVQWTRPFLPQLGPLAEGAARETFMDITDNFHDSTDVDQVLHLTDNMPLAINLIAHLVDSDGCATVLSRWEKERTCLVSEGFDKTSNLHLSISLSLSSPRMMSLPQSQDLLSLLSILPDGLSDLELVQSKLPIAKILACKAALIRTSLAYIDDRKRIKVLVPIREYMQRCYFLPTHIVQSLLRYFHQLLETTHMHVGTVSASLWLAHITSNHANIGDLLLKVIQQQDNPDLSRIIHSTLLFSHVSALVGPGYSGLIEQAANLVPQVQELQVRISCIILLIVSEQQALIPNLEVLITSSLQIVHDLDAPDLKVALYRALGFYHANRTKFSTALKFFNMALPLVVSNGRISGQACILYGLAETQTYQGEYTAALLNASKAQTLAKMSGDLYLQAWALHLEGVIYTSLGNYTQCVSSYHQAQESLGLCGMLGGELDLNIRGNLAEVHRLKSEYVEAQNMRAQILDIVKGSNPYAHAWTLMCLVTIGVATGVPEHDLRTNISAAKSMLFRHLGYSEMYCDIIWADIELREGNMGIAMSYLQKCLHPLRGDSAEYISWSLERLANGNHWTAAGWDSCWATVYLVHSLKLKRRLDIHKALQYLGSMFLSQREEDTAHNLFMVALDGFTHMDVHRSRAECMLQLGDIAQGHGSLGKAVTYWRIARPLFARSSQAKGVTQIGDRLAKIDTDVRNATTCPEYRD